MKSPLVLLALSALFIASPADAHESRSGYPELTEIAPAGTIFSGSSRHDAT